jgi:hypothetical protein
MFLKRVLHSKASCCGVSRGKILIYQSTPISCRIASQDNPMMIKKFRDEMTLKTTLLV